jgi:putative transposase
MSDYRRWYVPGGTLFFTLVTYRRRPLLTEPLARRCLRQAIQIVRAKRPFAIPAFVLLPDHLHALWTLPHGDADYSVRWRRIKEEFTRRYLHEGGLEVEQTVSRRRRNERGVWQRRFWEHAIRDEVDLERHFDYIHYNPVKHGLATCPRDWPFSSFHRCVCEHHYPPDWGCPSASRPCFDGLNESVME